VQKRREIDHAPVIECARGALDDHHAGLGTVRKRMLGNQLRGQVIKKLAVFMIFYPRNPCNPRSLFSWAIKMKIQKNC